MKRVDRRANPLLTIRTYSYTVDEKILGVRVQLEKEDAQKLSEISRQYLGKTLSFVIGKSTVTSPTVKDVTKGDGIQLTVEDRQQLRELETALKVK